jgi:uncharacterized protein YggE
MRSVALACLVASLSVDSARAQSRAPAPASQPAIVTIGEAVVRRPPDVAYVTVQIESRAKSPRDAQRQNADAAGAVQKQLAAAGVSREAQRTLGLWLDQEYDVISGRRVARDFVARNTLEIRIDDVSRAGEIVDSAVQGGATSLQGVRFDLKDRSSAEREALRAAVADARARAEAAAAGAGVSVERILRIEDSRTEVVRPQPMVMRAEAAASTAVEPGLVEIRARVELTVAID